MKKVLLWSVIVIICAVCMVRCVHQGLLREEKERNAVVEDEDLILCTEEGDKNYWITVEAKNLHFSAIDGIVTVPDEAGLFHVGDKVYVDFGHTVEGTKLDETGEKFHYKKKNGKWECVLETGQTVSVKFRVYGGGEKEMEEGKYDYIEGKVMKTE